MHTHPGTEYPLEKAPEALAEHVKEARPAKILLRS